VNAIAASGITQVIECGPGKVLAGLTKRINGALIGDAIYDQETLEKVLAALGPN
jgi:[acyl-carrier-protein] S-malonyltransferase